MSCVKLTFLNENRRNFWSEVGAIESKYQNYPQLPAGQNR